MSLYSGSCRARVILAQWVPTVAWVGAEFILAPHESLVTRVGPEFILALCGHAPSPLGFFLTNTNLTNCLNLNTVIVGKIS